jgi:hypothetical protein
MPTIGLWAAVVSHARQQLDPPGNQAKRTVGRRSPGGGSLAMAIGGGPFLISSTGRRALLGGGLRKGRNPRRACAAVSPIREALKRS